MRLTLDLPEALAQELRQTAQSEGRSLSSLAAEALDLYLRQKRRRALGQALLERAGRVQLGQEVFQALEEGRLDRP